MPRRNALRTRLRPELPPVRVDTSLCYLSNANGGAVASLMIWSTARSAALDLSNAVTHVLNYATKHVRGIANATLTIKTPLNSPHCRPRRRTNTRPRESRTHCHQKRSRPLGPLVNELSLQKSRASLVLHSMTKPLPT